MTALSRLADRLSRPIPLIVLFLLMVALSRLALGGWHESELVPET